MGATLLALAIAPPAARTASAQDSDPYAGGKGVYFPSANTNDFKFLTLAGGAALATLAGDRVTMALASDRNSPQLQFGIFDGDTSGRWDLGATPLEYTLYKDPNGDGKLDDASAIWQRLGNTMPDNQWAEFIIPNSMGSPAPSGNYFYVLVIRNTNPGAVSASSFKVRTLGTVAMSPQEISFIAPAFNATDIAALGADRNTSPYDGKWRFYVTLSAAAKAVFVWDGDMDYGSPGSAALGIGETRDTVDPDTPKVLTLDPDFVPVSSTDPAPYVVVPKTSAPSQFVPYWAKDTTAIQDTGFGDPLNPASTGFGSPMEDKVDNPAQIRLPEPNPGSPFGVVYNMLAPNGQRYWNLNPSGTGEWEHFRVDTRPAVPADHYASVLPSGIYEINLSGVDANNLNALRFSHASVGVSPEGNPVPPLSAKPLVGDTVFRDLDADGVQDAGEPGIPLVTVNLCDGAGNRVNTTVTNADGKYRFEVESNGTWSVKVDTTSAALAGLGGTSPWGSLKQDQVAEVDNLDYDFGYSDAPGELGDKVWLDSNRNGIYEPEIGEVPLVGAKLALGSASRTIGANASYPLDTEVHDYLYAQLVPGSYTVKVTWLPQAGLVPTFDADGTGTPHVATVALGAGGKNYGVDFGYVPAANPGTGTPGYWKNHSKAWPVAQLLLGSATRSKAQAEQWLDLPKSGGDASLILVYQLIAAKLNVGVGNDSRPIQDTIRAADAWLATYGIGTGIKTSSPEGSQATALAATLDDYNNGRLGVPHRN